MHIDVHCAEWIAVFICYYVIHTVFLFLFRGKKYDRLNIALLTDLNTQASPEHLDVIIENLKQAGITLQFL